MPILPEEVKKNNPKQTNKKTPNNKYISEVFHLLKKT